MTKCLFIFLDLTLIVYDSSLGCGRLRITLHIFFDIETGGIGLCNPGARIIADWDILIDRLIKLDSSLTRLNRLRVKLLLHLL